MSRNHYEPAFGVAPLCWTKGDPPNSYRVVLVEVWRSALHSIDPTWANPTRPGVQISATVEARIHVGGEWQVVGYNGTLRTPEDGAVRRWAPLPSRSWSATITLDGWDSLSSGERTHG